MESARMHAMVTIPLDIPDIDTARGHAAARSGAVDAGA